MTDTHNNTNSDEVNVAALLRLAADHELSDEQRARLDTHLEQHPEDNARIQCEQNLRTACGRVMAQAAAPAGLMDRVREAIAADETDDVIGRVNQHGATTRRAPAWRSVLNIAAVVAVAAISLTFLRGVFTDPSTEALAKFVKAEHEHCIDDPGHAGRKLSITELEAVPLSLRKIIGTSISIPDIESAGYHFIGAGPCAVPGGDSAHLVFESTDALLFDGTLSLYIQRSGGFLEIEPGQTYTFEADPAGRVLVWEADDILYYLVADTDAQRKQASNAMALPDPSGSL